MDSKTLTSRLAKALGTESSHVAVLTSALSSAIAEIGGELDSAAIPGFGTFLSEKTNEHITVDPISGERILVPPSITLHFQPSVVLRKKLTK
ncbi:MAG: HU family DNA-binding protein [Muribaculaceae bacterium]|nr:HU family DNA-binding protein [Muribaculaceae bacterium]